MGIDGTIPPLQDGGVHDAVTAALPAAGEVTVAEPPKAVLVPRVTATEAGLLVFHTSGTPVMVCPALSVTTASTVTAAPLPTTIT